MQANALVTKAYATKASGGCPADGTVPAAEQADLDVIATIDGLTFDTTMAGDLRTTARQVSTALTGGRLADACAKVASFSSKVGIQLNKKLTANQATTLAAAADTVKKAIGSC